MNPDKNVFDRPLNEAILFFTCKLETKTVLLFPVKNKPLPPIIALQLEPDIVLFAPPIIEELHDIEQIVLPVPPIIDDELEQQVIVFPLPPIIEDKLEQQAIVLPVPPMIDAELEQQFIKFLEIPFVLFCIVLITRGWGCLKCISLTLCNVFLKKKSLLNDNPISFS